MGGCWDYKLEGGGCPHQKARYGVFLPACTGVKMEAREAEEPLHKQGVKKGGFTTGEVTEGNNQISE